MNDTRTIMDSGKHNSIGLCSIDVIYSTEFHGKPARGHGTSRRWPRGVSRMKIYTGKDSGNIFEIIEGLKVYSDHSLF